MAGAWVEVAVIKWLDRLVMLWLTLFLAIHPFHHLLYERVLFYREGFAVLFSATALLYMVSKTRRSLLERWEIRVLVLWLVWVLGAYFVDPGISLYGDSLSEASLSLSRVSPRDYVLRTTLLYCPLFLSIYLRGIGREELVRLALLVTLVSIASIVTNFQAIGVQTFAEAVGRSARSGLGYNNYVPYVTFPLACGLLVMGASGTRRLRVLAASAVAFQLLFLLVNPSRQSVLFAGLLVISYLVVERGHRALLAGVALAGLVYWGIPLIGAKEFTSARFLSSAALETSRFSVATEGLAHLRDLPDWAFGRGFSSVVVSGPHNNYIRVTQRMGLLGAFLTFSPFVVVFARLWRSRLGRWEQADGARHLVWFSLAVVGFTLFHSLFGYPQDDAWQAPYVWFGLAVAMTATAKLKRGRDWG